MFSQIAIMSVLLVILVVVFVLIVNPPTAWLQRSNKDHKDKK
jgi:type II secretory pathway component PulM